MANCVLAKYVDLVNSGLGGFQAGGVWYIGPAMTMDNLPYICVGFGVVVIIVYAVIKIQQKKKEAAAEELEAKKSKKKQRIEL